MVIPINIPVNEADPKQRVVTQTPFLKPDSLTENRFSNIYVNAQY